MLQYSQTNQLFGGFQARPTRPFFGLVWFGLIFFICFCSPEIAFQLICYQHIPFTFINSKTQ